MDCCSFEVVEKQPYSNLVLGMDLCLCGARWATEELVPP